MKEGGAVTAEQGQDTASHLSDPFLEENQELPTTETGLESQSNGSSVVGDRNAGPTYLPVRTLSKTSSQSESLEGNELKAYKLGKKRWLYNECRIKISSASGCYRNLQLKEATRMLEDVLAPELMDCGVAYTISLKNGQRLDMEVYLAFDQPEPAEEVIGPDAHLHRELHAQCSPGYRWPAVKRSRCAKGCTGPVLRPIQRMGRQSRRTDKRLGVPEANHDQPKDLSCLYLSIDEATNHVGGTRFRLVAAVFDIDRICLATCCSAPILVLANNDAPNGPACIELDLAINDNWEGWPKAEMESEFTDALTRNLSTESMQHEHYRLDSIGPAGSARFADSIPMLESTGRHAHASLEFIRARARQHQQEEEEDEPYEETPSKRQCSAYLRSSDLPRDIFQHPPAFPLARLDGPFLTEDRIRINAPLDPRSLRHDSMTDSSTPYSIPSNSLNIRRAHSSSSRNEIDLAAMQFATMPMHSELQAQRIGHNGPINRWQQQPDQGGSNQVCMVRQESLPAALLRHSRETSGYNSTWGSVARVDRVANPIQLEAYQPTFTNPFAHSGNSRHDLPWIQNVRPKASADPSNR